MPSIPLIVVWFAVLCGYLPYSLGFAFLNPLIVIAYGFLGLLVAANVPHPRYAAIAAAATTLLALAVVNITSGIPHLVLPATSIILASIALSVASTLAGSGLRSRWLSQGLDEDRVRLYLRLLFAAFALLVYGNGYLPLDAKIWLAEHTTNNDLLIFAMVSIALFVGTWRMTNEARR